MRVQRIISSCLDFVFLYGKVLLILAIIFCSLTISYRWKFFTVRKPNNNGKVDQKHRKVVIFQVINDPSIHLFARNTVNCYAKMHGYKLITINVHTDIIAKNNCNHSDITFQRQCVAAHYLQNGDGDWMLFLDGDTGVVNPHHRIEDYIDDRYNLIFYERFFNFEIACGNYLVRKTAFSYNFLMSWANYDYLSRFGQDNAALMALLMETLLPEEKSYISRCIGLWKEAKNYAGYYKFLTCARFSIGAKRQWPPNIKLIKRGHSWVIDNTVTHEFWCEKIFMVHLWKGKMISERLESPFTQELDVSQCNSSMKKWPWREKYGVSCQNLSTQILSSERYFQSIYPSGFASKLPYLVSPDVGDCWPNCI